MRDCVYIGPVPCEEECQQVGTPAYDANKARLECRVFLNQLRRMFGPEPDGAKLKIKTEIHDAGSYQEVVCYYDNEKPASVDYAFRCEAESPQNWDVQALADLSPPSSITRGFRLPILTIGAVLNHKNENS